MDAIYYLIAALSGQAVLLAVVAALGKGLLSQVLARELEAYKANLALASAQSVEQLKADLSRGLEAYKAELARTAAIGVEQLKAELSKASAIAVEQLKHELAIKALERQVTFAKLHERRAEVLAELYATLVAATSAVEAFVWRDVADGSEEWRAKYHKAADATSQLFAASRASRIYLSDGLAEQLEAYARRLHSEVVGLAVYTKVSDAGLSPAALDTKWAACDKANAFVQEQLPIARKALETEFQRALEAAK